MMRRAGHAVLAASSVVVGSVAGLVGNYLVGGFRTALLVGFIALVATWGVLEGVRAVAGHRPERASARVRQVLSTVAGEAVAVDGQPKDSDVSAEQSVVRVETGGRVVGLRTGDPSSGNVP